MRIRFEASYSLRSINLGIGWNRYLAYSPKSFYIFIHFLCFTFTIIFAVSALDKKSKLTKADK